MRCPGCGYENIGLLETCEHCGAPLGAGAVAPGTPPVDRAGEFVETLDDDGTPFRIDDDLFMGHDPGAPELPGTAPGPSDWADQGGFWQEAAADLPGPAFVLSGEEPGPEEGGEPIIDRYDEVPERFWAPEVAGLGRRALALAVDQSLLLAILGVFFLGAFMALRIGGFDTGLLLAAAGLQASALPFSLLAAVLGFAYYIFFHHATGCTPGKALVGIEVRTSDGGALTWRRTILRWLGAALGLACAGVGIFWAIFEPRRRGWADLISGTVVARLRREPAASA